MPFHNEMSDAVFMAGPILAATGKLTGERKYFDAAATHFASMRKLCLRTDGIYRHSPLCEAAWGRGNGFPALGLALALSDWPDDHPAKKELIAEFQKHLAALKPHQDAKTGCWHQVIDHPESYDEYSCTCMIGFAMQRGIRRGWLAKDEYQPCVDRAWRADQGADQRRRQAGQRLHRHRQAEDAARLLRPPRDQRPRRPRRRDGADVRGGANGGGGGSAAVVVEHNPTESTPTPAWAWHPAPGSARGGRESLAGEDSPDWDALIPPRTPDTCVLSTTT